VKIYYVGHTFTLYCEHTVRITNEFLVVGFLGTSLKLNCILVFFLLSFFFLMMLDFWGSLLLLNDQVKLIYRVIINLLFWKVNPHSILHGEESLTFVDILWEYVNPLFGFIQYFHGVFFSVEILTSLFSLASPSLSSTNKIFLDIHTLLSLWSM